MTQRANVDFVDESAGITIHFVVASADYGRSLLRTVLMEATPVPDGMGVAQGASLMASRILYPCMVAAVETHDCTGLFETWPPSLDEFLNMPEELGIAWERAAFEVNPRWRARADASKEATETTKKANGSSEQSDT